MIIRQNLTIIHKVSLVILIYVDFRKKIETIVLLNLMQKGAPGVSYADRV